MNINGAVGQLYQEMAGRHRADPGSIQIIHAATVADEKCRREHVLEMHDKKLKFPIIRPRETSKCPFISHPFVYYYIINSIYPSYISIT